MDTYTQSGVKSDRPTWRQLHIQFAQVQQLSCSGFCVVHTESPARGYCLGSIQDRWLENIKPVYSFGLLGGRFSNHRTMKAWYKQLSRIIHGSKIHSLVFSLVFKVSFVFDFLQFTLHCYFFAYIEDGKTALLHNDFIVRPIQRYIFLLKLWFFRLINKHQKSVNNENRILSSCFFRIIFFYFRFVHMLIRFNVFII